MEILSCTLTYTWMYVLAHGRLRFSSYSQEYRGQMAIQAAVLVAYTQIIPEHQIVLFGSNLKIRVKVPVDCLLLLVLTVTTYSVSP